MNLQRQLLFWLGAFLAFVLVIWLLSDILLPFVAGMAIAYLLNPLTDKIVQMGVGRIIAALLVVGVFVMFFVIVIILLAPVLGNQMFNFAQRLPEYIVRLQDLLSQEYRQWAEKLIGDLPDIQKTVAEFATRGVSWVGTFLTSLWSGGRALISLLSLIVITPVVAFYLLNDWHSIVAKVDSWTPLRHRANVRSLARQIDRAIAGFIRGQSSVCLILGLYYALALSLAGLNFALLIGFLAGLLTFIPFVGSLTGLLIATIVAFAQFMPAWTPVIIVLAIFLVGQFVEGYILTPKLVGESVGLHPVWLMFALFAFGYLLGFVGLLVAVPLAAAVGVLMRFALSTYLASPIYTDQPRLYADERSIIAEDPRKLR